MTPASSSEAPAAPAAPVVPSAGFEPHPLRNFVLSEMLARPFTLMPNVHRVLHFAFMPEGEARASDRRALRALCQSRGLPGPASGAKYYRADLGDVILRWEGHSEFTTYTFEVPASPADEPFQPGAADYLHLMQQFPQPGPILAMVDLHILPASTQASVLSGAPVQDLAIADVEDGAARIVTNFQAGNDGFVRIAILDRSLTPAQTGALTQRVLEIETYRTLALLGLPLAQELGPRIRQIELQLPNLMNEMRATGTIAANRDLLDRLTALAAELETDAAASSYRFGATRAYGELVRLRLEAIGERALPGSITWSGFLNRRLSPALRTVSTMETRQDQLSRKLSRAAQLLRTRVEIDLETQNGEVLRAMNDRARLQLRLQQTVEGLSVAAISYYIASLAHHVFEGIHAAGWHVDPLIATAVSVPVSLALVAYVVWRIRHHHTDVNL